MSESTVRARDEANQRYLMASLERVRAALGDAGAGGAGGGVASADGGTPGQPASVMDGGELHAGSQAIHEKIRALRAAMDGPPPLDHLCQAFALSPFERDVLLLCAGVELDASFAATVADAARPGGAPTFGLALAALPEPHWSALAPGGPLRRWRLVEVGAGDRLVASPLRIDERVLHYLTGVHGLDEQLQGFVQPLAGPAVRLAPSQAAVAEEVAGAWAAGSQPLPVVQIVGPAPADARAVARAAAERLGMTLHVMEASVLPSGPHERDVLMRLWEREAVLGGSALLVEVEGTMAGDPDRAALLRHFLETTAAALLVSAPERLPIRHRPTVTIAVRKPTAPEQRQLWVSLLGRQAGPLNGQVDRLAGQFDLSLSAIETAWSQAQVGSGGGEPEEPAARRLAPADGGAAPGGQAGAAASAADTLGRRLWSACRSQARPQLSDLAQRIEPAATWDELVLPELQTRVLHEIEMHVRHRMTVYESWGFAAKSSRGLGISALFAGPSGTGKTMAAEVLAGALELDLYRIDLSRVVNKYIGETEKNLARVFDAAEQGGAILLFDEADALFGKRSEVKDSHDRYANIEVSYLLQRMEAYRGLAILTSNLKGALDDAFLRRLRFIVTFPFPDPAQRSAIWRRIFPPETPTDGLDPDRLARLNVTGGNIRNIAMHAAFLAADAGRAVAMEDVLRAARTEYAKLERPLTDAEIRGWT